MERVKDIFQRIDWKEVAWVQGPRLAMFLWILFGFRAIAATTVAAVSTRTPDFTLPGDFWLWMVPQALFWLAILILSVLMLFGQFRDWQEKEMKKKKKQGKQLFSDITGLEFRRDI